MELTLVVAVKDIGSNNHRLDGKVCDQGRSVGKIKFTRNRKMVGNVGGIPPPRNFLSEIVRNAEKLLKSRKLNGAPWCYLKRSF